MGSSERSAGTYLSEERENYATIMAAVDHSNNLLRHVHCFEGSLQVKVFNEGYLVAYQTGEHGRNRQRTALQTIVDLGVALCMCVIKRTLKFASKGFII